MTKRKNKTRSAHEANVTERHTRKSVRFKITGLQCRLHHKSRIDLILELDPIIIAQNLDSVQQTYVHRVSSCFFKDIRGEDKHYISTCSA